VGGRPLCRDRWQPHKVVEDPRELDATVTRVRDVSAGTGAATRSLIALDLQTVDGQKTSLLVAGAALENEVERLRPDVGERLFIVYCGLALKNGSSHHVWRIGCPERSGASVYEHAFGAEPDEPVPTLFDPKEL
jgi:hypothetical protein